jgi:hypothetical protein
VNDEDKSSQALGDEIKEARWKYGYASKPFYIGTNV